MAVRSLKNSTLESFENYSSSMNAGYDFNDFELIESVFLSGSASSVTFNNLNQYATEYKHLQIRMVGRSNRGTVEYVRLRFNGDSGSNYSMHQLYGGLSAVYTYGAGSQDRINILRFAGDTNNPLVHGAIVADLLDVFNTSKNKTVRAFGGVSLDSPSNWQEVALNSGAWYSTSQVSTIDLIVGGGTLFLSGSRFSLYGIR